MNTFLFDHIVQGWFNVQEETWLYKRTFLRVHVGPSSRRKGRCFRYMYLLVTHCRSPLAACRRKNPMVMRSQSPPADFSKNGFWVNSTFRLSVLFRRAIEPLFRIPHPQWLFPTRPASVLNSTSERFFSLWAVALETE